MVVILGEHIMLKRASILIVFMLFSTAAFAASSGATVDPSQVGVGARPLAMGKAFVGFKNDASSIFINPAGLADIKFPKATSMSGQLLSDINYVVVGGAGPTDYGTFGIGYISATLPNIPVTTITGSGTTAVVVPAGSTSYYSSIVTLSYANDVNKLPMLSNYNNMTFGVNLKYFMQGFNGGGSALKDANGTGFDMDLGVQYVPRKEVTLGFSALNFLPESMGGRFVWEKANTTENIPAVVKLGGMAKIFGPDSFYGTNQVVNFAIDMDMHPTQDRMSVYHLGVEWWPISIMALRAGVDQNPIATESSNGVENNYTAGIGLKFKGYTFDYCYHQYSDLTENTTHFFSIGFVGDEDKEQKPKASKVILPVVVKSASLESFPDVPKDYWARSPIEFMATLGIMNGYHDGLFRPEETVTRAELATMLIKLRELDVNDAMSDPYPDVSKDYWAAKYIKAASYINAMKSYPDGSFKPDNKVTRVEGVVILSRYTDAPEPKALSKDPFVDISRTHWAASSIMAAQNYGILDYLIGKKFDPNKGLTRAELAEMLSKTSFGKDRIRKYLNASIY
jgi:hypothetical protein